MRLCYCDEGTANRVKEIAREINGLYPKLSKELEDISFTRMNSHEQRIFLSPTTAEAKPTTDYTPQQQQVVDNRRDAWVPACGGKERPQKYRSGVTLLYCWNPGTGEHAFLDCTTDMFLTEEEAIEATR